MAKEIIRFEERTQWKGWYDQECDKATREKMLPTEGPWKKDAQEQDMKNTETKDVKKSGYTKKKKKNIGRSR
jgi:hypothetical protein